MGEDFGWDHFTKVYRPTTIGLHGMDQCLCATTHENSTHIFQCVYNYIIIIWIEHPIRNNNNNNIIMNCFGFSSYRLVWKEGISGTWSYLCLKVASNSYHSRSWGKEWNLMPDALDGDSVLNLVECYAKLSYCKFLVCMQIRIYQQTSRKE